MLGIHQQQLTCSENVEIGATVMRIVWLCTSRFNHQLPLSVMNMNVCAGDVVSQSVLVYSMLVSSWIHEFDAVDRFIIGIVDVDRCLRIFTISNTWFGEAKNSTHCSSKEKHLK